jgi:glutamine cyclotransferase
MKKYLVIILIVIVGGALLIIPLMKKDEPENPTPDNPIEQSIPAVFDFKGNPGTIAGKESILNIKLDGESITKVEVKHDGVVMQSWENPTADLVLKFTPQQVGTKSLELFSYTADGESYVDSRSLRVLSDITPSQLTANVVKKYPHSPTSFTQGLEFYNGKLYEGIGLYGQSKIMEVDLKTGDPKRSLGLDGSYFGEGITIMNDVLYQITWKKGTCLMYDISGDAFQLKTEDFSYNGEGWGLCNDDEFIIMSDGTERLTFRDPNTFQVVRTIDVYNDRGPIGQLNELEYINGKIFANVYLTNLVISIDPATGKVLEQIDCTELEKQGKGTGDVLNGIAVDGSGKVYMTGKNWFNLFEVSF